MAIFFLFLALFDNEPGVENYNAPKEIIIPNNELQLYQDTVNSFH